MHVAFAAIIAADRDFFSRIYREIVNKTILSIYVMKTLNLNHESEAYVATTLQYATYGQHY